MGRGCSSTSQFQLKNMTCATSRELGLCCAVFFLGGVGYAIQHSVDFAESQIKSFHDTSTVKMRSRNALASFLQCCRWVVAKRTCVAVWSSLSMCEIHLHKLLLRQAVGEGTVNTCWKDPNFGNSCHARNTVPTFKDRFHLFHVAFICC